MPAFSLLLDLRTQWRISPFGRVLGLDYGALQVAMNLRGVKRKRRGALFDQVRVMEMAAMRVLNAA